MVRPASTVGEEISAKVVEMDPGSRKIGLSVKELQKDQEQAAGDEALESLRQEDDPATTVGDSLGPELQKKLAAFGAEAPVAAGGSGDSKETGDGENSES